MTTVITQGVKLIRKVMASTGKIDCIYLFRLLRHPSAHPNHYIPLDKIDGLLTCSVEKRRKKVHFSFKRCELREKGQMKLSL